MTKHLSIQKVLATLLTIVAVFAGQQASATIQNSIRMLGRTQNNRYFFAIESFGQMDQLVNEQGTSHTFNNATIAGVTLNGTLNFQQGTAMTDVITATSFTVTIESSTLWFYGATVQTKSGTNVTGCTVTTSSNHNTLTVTIPTGKTFGAIIVDYVSNPPMTNSNTTVTVPQGDYWVSNSSHKPQPEPTVVYGQTTLVKDTDYTLSWSNNGSAGTGTVTVTGIGNYAGSATGTFPIRWARYYVHFDKNHDDANGTMSDQQFTYNTAQALTDNTFSRTGYSFIGWSTTSNGAVTYTDGQSVSNLTAEDGQTVTLYAQWTLNYNITYDLDGGSVAPPNPTTYNVTTPTFTLNNPTKVACNFDGWTGSNGDTPETTVTIAQGSTGDRSYTAQWTQYAFTLSWGTGITASGTVAFTYEGTDYYAVGTEITLAYGGTIPEGQHLVFEVNGNAIVGNTFEMPAADVVVDAVLLELERYYIYNSTTGVLALLWGEFNRYNKWGSEVTPSAVTSVTATDEVSFTGDCYNLFQGFTNCTSMDLSNVNTDALTSMKGMFSVCSGLTTLDLSGWNTANVTDMSFMFYGCSGLQSLNVSGWNTANVTNMYYMFYGCSGLQSLNVSGWNTANVTNMSAMFRSCSGLQSLDLSGWNTANVTDMSNMFDGCSGLQSLDLSGWNTANVTYMSDMFYGCRGLQSLDLSRWNTANVTDMNYMFSACSGLQSLNVSGWSTANVTEMSNMFYGCSGLQSLDLSGWNTAMVTDMNYMFSACSGLQSLNISGWNTAYVSDMSGMFDGCSGLQSLNVSGWNTAKVTDMSGMFSNCSGLQSLNVSGWNTAKVTYMSYMFNGCSGLQSLDLSGWNTAKVSDMSRMFQNCTNLATIYVGEGWSTSWVNWSDDMFFGCTSLVGGMGTAYDANHIDKEYARIDGGPDNPGYLSRLRYTFNSTTGELALLWGEFNRYNKWGSEVTASEVTSVTATDEVSFTGDCYQLFYNFTSCTSMDLTDVNTANVSNMSGMFDGCSDLQSLDLSGWNTANVTNMSGMFDGCSGLQSLDLSGWNTDKVTSMGYMFHGCSGLQSLNISGWNTANVTNMQHMFEGCTGLQSLDLSGWNTANVTDMSFMFRGCSGLQSLNVSGWNTAKVTNMQYMFNGCFGLQSLDLSGWNTANVTNMSYMFRYCTDLATIYVGGGWSTSWVGSSNYMFSGCTSLVGGMGTHYISIHTDKAYARIDGGPHNPGYFTEGFTKEIAGYEDNASGWYLIASPLAADIAPTAVTNMTNETFDLYCFDQTGGTNGKEWKNWKNEGGDGYHFNLEAGKGYLYANSENVTLSFTGTPYNGDGVVNLTYSTDNPNATMHGWNLIGNPFTDSATLSQPYYRMNAIGSALNTETESKKVAAMEGVFVKATAANQTVTFTAQTRGSEQAAIAYANIMVVGDNGVIDNAILRFDGGQTLEKFSFRKGSTKIYFPQGDTDYAIACAEGHGEIPVNFEATENGTYTLTVNPEGVELGYLHLIDNLTGNDVDLLTPPAFGHPLSEGEAQSDAELGEATAAGRFPLCMGGQGDYTFTAKTTDYASRFRLVFSTTTEATDDDEDAPFAFISNGNIIVNGEGTLQVLDMMGRIVRSTDAKRGVSTNGMQVGVYVLRLINGDTIRMQKVVVR